MADTLRAIDCDIHPSVTLSALTPYLSDHWRATAIESGLNDIEMVSYPAGSPLTARADWRPASGKPAADLDAIRAQALDPFNTSIAICNCLWGVQVMFNEDMAAAFARAINTWMARERLDAEPRLRASIVIPMQNPETAADEIEHWAGDKRFVQVLMLVSGDQPLGRRSFWPIYRTAEKHGLPIAIHAGSAYRNPVTAVGWPSYYTEDYVNQAQAFQTTLTSLICEGVFDKFPQLKVVLTESGFTWLPSLVWRLTKFWKGLRHETPWVDRPPYEIVRDQVRLTLQPVDAPPDAQAFEKLMEHMGSDRLLLYSTDYPHWQFDGVNALPDGLSPPLIRRMMVDNPLETHPRLREATP
ncbi:amidohydrolase family protein [Terrarubrum flagellatum]|uniref:amidohydrolase family protein n=1 Tax=Terrirubrum flagellatum TaxID=2895980 RepID=UPI0031455D09